MEQQRPLRVLHVIGGLHLGGAETLLYRLATRPRPGVEHEIVCLGSPDWYSGPLQQHGVKVHHLCMRSPLSVRGILALARLIRGSRADVVQSWMYVANLLSGVLGRLAGVPVVWGIHASGLDHAGPSSRLCAKIAGRGSRALASWVVNCSRRSAEFHAALGYGAAPGSVIPNGYDPEAFHPDEERRRETRRELGIPPGTFVIGTIGRWHAEKDIPALLRAAAALRSRGVDLTCLLVGPRLDDANAQLAAAIAEAGCEGLVRPLGRKSNVADYARALDVHVLPSRSEAFPNSVAETMLAGTPNVVTDVGDAALMAGSTGWVVPPRDSDKLADAIEAAYRAWTDGPEAWQARRREARESIAGRFGFDRMAEAYEQVWARVARRR